MKLTIIGAGPGGYSAAFAAAKAGVEVTLVERAKLGGTCLQNPALVRRRAGNERTAGGIRHHRRMRAQGGHARHREPQAQGHSHAADRP